jgi:hypothetical protein
VECLFKLITSFKCPLCGFTRSIISLFELDITNFFYFNSLSILYILVFTSMLLKKEIKYKKLILFVIILFGIVRNLEIYKFY